MKRGTTDRSYCHGRTRSSPHCILEEQTALLEKLGKHKIGKSCLYINKLEDIHLPTLEKLIKKAIQSPRIQGAETIK